MENFSKNKDNEWRFAAVIYNNTDNTANIYLENHKYLPENWVVIADKNKAGLEKISTCGRNVYIDGKSIKILVDEESYNKIKF